MFYDMRNESFFGLLRIEMRDGDEGVWVMIGRDAFLVIRWDALAFRS